MRDFHQPNRSLVYATRGMAATSHPLASRIAVDTLAAGGNAVDAAIAAAFTLCVAEPHMTGIGGDCFALIQPADGSAPVGLNGSGRAPAALDAAALRAAGLREMPLTGVESVTVPGAVDGLVRLSADHGRLGLDRVMAPAIRAMEDGVPVAPRVAQDWRAHAGRLQGAARDLFLEGGRPPAEGTPFRMPRQAAVLRRVAAEGRDGFYKGPVADALLAALGAHGGSHTQDDLDAQRAEYVAPVRGRHGPAEMVELPPNGQGVTALLMAAILQRLEAGRLDPLGWQRIHLEAEAAKLAYAQRNLLVAEPGLGEGWRAMLEPALADTLAGQVRMDTALPEGPALPGAPHRDTVYLCTADGDGMAVSLIMSLFNAFGSGLADAETGIVFHNRGAGFTLAEGHANEAGPRKRPMHTIIPALLAEDGVTNMAFGVMGGHYQAAGHVRFVSNLVDHGMDPQRAIEAPRSFVEDGELRLEAGYPAAHHARLAALGHRVVVPPMPIGGAQAIRLDRARGVLAGASDPRKDGCALGL